MDGSVPEVEQLRSHIQLWTHACIALSGYAVLSVVIATTCQLLQYPASIGLCGMLVFDVHCLVLLTVHSAKFRGHGGLWKFFEAGHDFACMLVVRLFLILKATEVLEVGLFQIGVFVYLPLVLCCFTRNALDDFSPCSSFMLSLGHRFFRGTLLTVAILKRELELLWDWSFVLYPMVVLGLLLAIVMMLGLFLVFQSWCDYRRRDCNLSSFLHTLWVQLGGTVYCFSLIFLYYGLVAYLDQGKYEQRYFLLTAGLYGVFGTYSLVFRARIRYGIGREEALLKALSRHPHVEHVTALYEAYPEGLYLQKVSDNFFKLCEDDYTGITMNHEQSNKLKESAALKTEMCSLCLAAEAKAVLMDCGHGGLCKECAIALVQSSRTCYLCRSPLESIMEIAANGLVQAKLVFEEISS